MEVQQVLHMNGGAGETSYANNSTLQEIVIFKVKTIVERSITDLYCTTFPKSLCIVDMGCSSGPNTLLAISNIMEAVDQIRRHLGRSSPEFRVFLNDLPGNDFNNIFKSLAGFYEKLKQNNGPDFGPCFIAGVPGSFYSRLFQTKSLDFVHSSYSLHWCSQVPPALENGLNKGNIYIANDSPPAVIKAYWEQYESDFSLFLKLRSEEVRSGGRMVLTIIGRKSPDPSKGECCHLWKLLAQALMSMVSQGIIKEAQVDSFNLPLYTPCIQELMTVIESEGSFHLDGHEVTEINWDPNDNDNNEGFVFDKFTSGRNAAKIIRAVAESMLANHFGEAIIEDLFKKYEENVAEHLAKEKTKYVNVTVSMTKK
ncbi:S-adenosyl-L-methionine:benzoic acid/salicylic acid carboxyl methyltransferase 2-like [Magnolia sinica]|uniref:S-adenosyl-L-methionine:benzoic acid/salicylic acid carboxyl methyltransferase 2-like n=1 Tax=Magnolia sinica TaxID=86752 RepID=UPI00265984AA|nr:S-adenosyl-L-methionine:benzoic acid/salicylic acid carboxyl methyltransferase 2-like [Magnolia sinica]